MLPDDLLLDKQHQHHDWQQHQYLLLKSDHSESESCETDHHYFVQRYDEDSWFQQKDGSIEAPSTT